MLKRLILCLPLLACLSAIAQKADTIIVKDTRGTDDLPITFQHLVRFDFKTRDAIGLHGSTPFSGMMTFAPWGDSSGNNIHQLNFNNDGIFYRQGAQGSPWQAWSKLLTNQGVQTINGGMQLIFDDSPLTFKTNKDKSYQYIGYYTSAGRNAWVGMDPNNNFNIVKENGGNIILTGGGVGIGTSNIGSCALAVEGTIGARKIKVTAGNWPDFVFEENYNLPTLKELATYLQQNKHLPDIPSAKEVAKEGIDLGEMNAKLLQKVEELSLYIIQQNEQLQKVTRDLEELKSKLNK